VFKRLIVIGLIGASWLVMSEAKVNAQIAGWGWFGFSSVRGVIDLSKVPPPQSKPSVVVATAILETVQIACVNPATNGIFPGKPFTAEVSDFNAVDDEDITDRKRGKATIEVSFVLDSFEVATNCQNNNDNWDVVDESAMVLAFSVGLEWHICTDEDLDGNGDPDPCVDIDPATDEEVFTIDETAKGLLDTANLRCTLDTTVYPRNLDGTAPHNAVFVCPEVP
jgi:hypothetical protein